MLIDEDKAELIGLHAGDGSLYRTKTGMVWELRGALEEKEFYNRHIKTLLESIFPLEFKPKFRSGGKNGCFGVQTTKRCVIEFFLAVGFHPGRKTHTVKIPHCIRSSSVDIQKAFIRGLFDTDGCLRFEKINKEILHRYPKIEFCSVSRSLRDELYIMLIDMGFRPYIWGKYEYKLCLAGEANLSKFMREIRPQNIKHLKKHLFWLKKGYYKSDNAAVA